MAKKKHVKNSQRCDPTNVDFDEEEYGEDDLDEMPLWLREKRQRIRDLLKREREELTTDERELREDGWHFLLATGPRELRRELPELQRAAGIHTTIFSKDPALLVAYYAALEVVKELEHRITTEDRP